MKTKTFILICICAFFTVNLGYARWPQPDPHAENYYPQSPYAFVGGNPINKVDPDGRDEYTINARGDMTFVRKSDEHWLYLVNNKGNYVNNNDGNKVGVQVSDVAILEGLYTNVVSVPEYDSEGNMIGKQVNRSVETESASGNDMASVFSFVGQNTNNEWALSYGTNANGQGVYGLATNGSPYGVFPELSVGIVGSIHSHPAPRITPGITGEKYSLGNDASNMARRNTPYRSYVYMGTSGNVWQVGNRTGALTNTGRQTPAQINRLLRGR